MSGSITEALVAAGRAVTGVEKDRKADAASGGYSYRSTEAVVNAARTALLEQGVVLRFEDRAVEVLEKRQTKAGNPRWLWRCDLLVELMHTSGDTLEFPVTSVTWGDDSRALGSARSYAVREVLSRCLLLSTGERDVEEDGSTDRGAPVQQEPAPSDEQMSQLKEIRSSLAELDEDDEQRQAGRAIWSSVTGRAGQYPTTYAQASELLTRLAEAGIYVPGGEPFDDPNDEEVTS